MSDLYTLSDGTVLDVTATRRQLALMHQIADGDRVVVARGGRGFCLERAVVPTTLVEQLVHRRWLVEPAYPLFGDLRSGRMTTRGEFAYARSL